MTPVSPCQAISRLIAFHRVTRRPTILTCENCGTELPNGASFCARCGSPVSVAQIGPVYVPTAPPPSGEIAAQQGFALPQARPAYAGFWLRAVAYLIDSLIISFPMLLVGSLDPSKFVIFPDPNSASRLAIPQLTPLAIALVVPFVWLYYAIFEASSWQATPGKRVLRLYVTDLNGRRITFARATIRHFAKMISSLTFLAGYIVAGFTEKKQTLHDIIASCLVLRRP
jgi:uncharacterized RDD family membrane protein YckC